jgi:hypothetical protein
MYKTCIAQARVEYAVEENVPDVAVLVDMIMADWYSGTSAAEPEVVQAVEATA